MRIKCSQLWHALLDAQIQLAMAGVGTILLGHDLSLGADKNLFGIQEELEDNQYEGRKTCSWRQQEVAQASPERLYLMQQDSE